MPAGAVEHQNGMGAWRDGAGDLGEVQVHRLGVGVRQDQGGAGGARGADGAEEARPS